LIDGKSRTFEKGFRDQQLALQKLSQLQAAKPSDGLGVHSWLLCDQNGKQKLMNKLKTSVIAGGIGILGAFCRVNAQDATTTNIDQTATTTTTTAATTTNTQFVAPADLYHAQELSFDAFAAGTVGARTINHLSGDRIRRDGRLGAGVGVNYFFCRYLGIDGEAYSEGATHSFVRSASGNLIFRFPILETGLAPYVFGGGGYQFDDIRQGFGQAGGGLEFRFVRHVSIFADARAVFASRSEDYGLGRAGLRISF